MTTQFSGRVGVVVLSLFALLHGDLSYSSNLAKIEHIVVLMLENRSFDHMLGHSGITGRDAETGRRTSIRGISEINVENMEYPPTPDADFQMKFDPEHQFGGVQLQLGARNGS